MDTRHLVDREIAPIIDLFPRVDLDAAPIAQIRAKALVTRRLRPLQIDGRTIHQVGMPWHWGYEGVVTGAIVNELTALVGDPNVSMHEGKAFVCNVEKA